MSTGIVHQGVLYKVGGNVKSWTKRWMILKTDYVLYYYKDPVKPPQGNIPLSDHMFQVKEGREKDLNWPKSVAIERTIVIRTSYRIYYMYAESHKEAAEWIAKLQDISSNMPGKKVKQRAESKPTLPSEASKPFTSSGSVSSSVGTVEAIYDAANQADSDCSFSDEENVQGKNEDYDVPKFNTEVDKDAVYELADHNPGYPLHSRDSSKSLTASLPLPPTPNNDINIDNQPVYEDAADLVEQVYDEVSRQPSWAASRHIPPFGPPPDPPNEDDEDTVPLPRPTLPPKDSSTNKAPPPVPKRGSSVLLNVDVSLPMDNQDDNGVDQSYSLLEEVQKPSMLPSAAMIQRSRIDSEHCGTVSPTEIDTLNYEPEESSEDFYVEMAASDEDTLNEDQEELEAQRQKELEEERERRLEAKRQSELETQRQIELEAQKRELEAQRKRELELERQKEAEAEIQRQREMELKQQELENERKQSNQPSHETEAQKQAEFEAKMKKEIQEKKQERIEYLANKSKVVPANSAAEAATDAKKRRSGTNMFKAQRNRLVESANTEDGAKPGSGAWLEIEREKNLMRDEKLRLEQEKRKFEEERQKFEDEKRQLQREMARLKQ